MVKLFSSLFLLGFIVVPIGDYAHVWSHTTGYPSHYAFYIGIIPFWVPSLFALAAVSLGGFHLSTRYFFPSIQPCKTSFATMMTVVFLFLGIYLLSSVLFRGHLIINNMIMAAFAITSWYVVNRKIKSLLLSILIAFFGTIVEIFFVSQGVFWYTEKDNLLFGVATWLPWIYMLASIAVETILDYFSTSSLTA